MKNLTRKAGSLVMMLAIVGTMAVPSAHASGQKFLVEQMFMINSSTLGVYFDVDDGGSISPEQSTTFTSAAYANESEWRDAIATAIIDWADNNSYTGNTTDDVLFYSPKISDVAVSGSYSDLIGKPDLGVSYEGITERTSSFPIYKSATVSSGTAVFNLTDDGTSNGNALFPSGVISDSVNLFVNDNSASYQMSYAFSNSNKTLTVTANKLTTANILTGILGQTQANGAVIKLSVWGY